MQDTRFAARQFRKNWVFTCTAVLVLAIGLAASVAIFAFVDAALIKPLPYQHPARLVGVFGSIPLFARSNLSYPDYLDLKKLNTVFASLDITKQWLPDHQFQQCANRARRSRERRFLSHARS